MTWLFRHVTDYDIVHGMSVFNFPADIYCEACRRRHVPHIIHPQGMFEPWAMANKGWKKRVYFRWFKKPQLERANVIHCLTQHEAESIAALGVTTPKVIVPNGINFESMSWRIRPVCFSCIASIQRKAWICWPRVSRGFAIDSPTLI
jgi:glycosyltransferase involved in cell wall biosynthesis